MVEPMGDRLANTDRCARENRETRADVAEDLLSVTDARAEKTSHTTAKKMYMRMRDSAKKNVVEAIPALSKMIERHMAAQSQPAATA